MPRTVLTTRRTLAQVKALAEEVQARDTRLAALLADREALDTELRQLRAEVVAARERNAALPDTHDYSETETRDRFIDLLLREAGWKLDQPHDREFEVRGMPNPTGIGYVDYVLWGNDGLPLAVVEAKRTRNDARKGQRQAELYADCLETEFGRRPVIFYTNGYEHWLWDDAQYPPRPVRDSTRRINWSCSSSDAPRVSHWPPRPSMRLSSNATTSSAPSAVSARLSSGITTAKRCW